MLFKKAREIYNWDSKSKEEKMELWNRILILNLILITVVVKIKLIPFDST